MKIYMLILLMLTIMPSASLGSSFGSEDEYYGHTEAEK